MDLNEYLRLLRRRWRLLAAAVLVAGVAAWVTTPSEPTNDDVTYTATHQLLRDTSASAPPALATVSLFAKTGEVPIRAAERLDFDGEPAVLAAGITLEPDEQIGTLELTARGNSARQAAERANVFAEEVLSLLGEQAAATQQEQIERVNEQLTSLQAEIDILEDELDAAEASDESTGTLQATRDSKLRQYGAALDQQQQVLNQPPPSAGYITLQPALPELATVESGGFSAPSSRPARTAIALVLGLFLGLGAVLLVERLDTRIHDVAGATAAFGLPVIAEVPLFATKKSDRRIMSRVEPVSAFAESYRTLRSALVLSPLTKLGTVPSRTEETSSDPHVVLVTSPAPGDGKTTTVANLAAVMAEAGRTVLVLGCDFRRPEIHGYLDAPQAPGIADILTGDNDLELEDVVQPTSVPGVFIAPSGAKLRSFGDVAAAGRQLVDDARYLADVVIIDTAPLLATNDASELIPSCDAVVVVSRIGKTTADASSRTRFLLERLGAPVAGVVAIGVPESHSSYAKYYTDASNAATTAEADRGGRHVRRDRGADVREASVGEQVAAADSDEDRSEPVGGPDPAPAPSDPETSSIPVGPVSERPGVERFDRPVPTNTSRERGEAVHAEARSTLSEGDGPDPRA